MKLRAAAGFAFSLLAPASARATGSGLREGRNRHFALDLGHEVH